jgi:TRAP-type C4-dicarboxylate transport system substrate-binding protein
MDTSERAARALDSLARRDDDRAYESMIERGMVEVDTSAHKAEWDAVAAQTRKNLTGRVYSKSLLEAVEKVAAAK